MPIHLEFMLTYKDYRNAARLHIRRSWWRRIVSFINWIGLPVIGGGFIGIATAMASDPSSRGTAIFVGLVGLCLISYPFYMSNRFKSCYRRTRIDDGNTSVELSEEGIHAESANMKTDYAWSAVKSLAEDKHLFMLYLAPAKFIAIPMRICTPQQIDELRSLFQRHIQPKAT